MGEGAGLVPGCPAEAGGDVADADETEGSDCEVSVGRHRLGCVPAPQLGGVLGEGDVSDVVQSLDRPVPADQLGDPGGRGLFCTRPRPIWSSVRERASSDNTEALCRSPGAYVTTERQPAKALPRTYSPGGTRTKPSVQSSSSSSQGSK